MSFYGHSKIDRLLFIALCQEHGNLICCEMIDDVTANCLSISHTYLAGNKRLLCITFQVVTLKAVSISRLLSSSLHNVMS